MAVDVISGAVLLIAKEPDNAIYQVPLFAEETVIAMKIGTLAPLPPPSFTKFIRHPMLSWYARRATGFDLSPDGSLGAVITYENAYLWSRQRGEAWVHTLSRKPCKAPMGGIRQYEGIAFVDGDLVVSQEASDRLRIFGMPHAKSVPGSICSLEERIRLKPSGSDKVPK
jgi:hypothetical protein